MTIKNLHEQIADIIIRMDAEDIRLNGPKVPTGGVCEIAGCKNKAEESWLPHVCALSEAGVEPDWVHICVEHDVQLNEHYLRFLCGDKYDSELEAYRTARADKL